MTEDDDVQTGRKQTLCQKYDIIPSQLDFKYVQECKNIVVLERILKVLRSSELGHYEKLQEVTEERLRLLAPNSRVLLTPEPVSSWNDLNTDQKDELTRDFLDWQSCDNKPSLEALKKEAEEKPRNYPAVRNSGKASIPTNEIQAQREKPAKSCVPRSFESWDNFNVEKELSLVDRPDELKDNQAIRANNEKKNNVESEEAIALEELGAGDGHLCSFANDERLKGNEFFKEQNYAKAIQHYNRSILLSPTAPAHSNRALCYIRTRNFEEAVKDCIRTQELNPNDQKAVSKALYHQSHALKELGRYQEAYEAIQNALKIDPNDKSIQDRANRLRNCMRDSNVAPVMKVRMAIEEQDSRRRNPHPLIEEIAPKDAYYPFTCGTESVPQSDIGTARLMCLCSGVPPFIAKLRSGESLPSSNRLCLRKTRSKKCFTEKNLSNRRKKTASFTNGEIIEKDTIEDVEKGHFNVHYGDLVDSLEAGHLKSIFHEMKILTPPEVCKALDGRLNPATLNLCVKALCVQPAEWNFLREHLVALSQLPQFRASVKSLDRATKEALSARIGSVEESGQRVSDIVTRYELNGALPPPS